MISSYRKRREKSKTKNKNRAMWWLSDGNWTTGGGGCHNRVNLLFGLAYSFPPSGPHGLAFDLCFFFLGTAHRPRSDMTAGTRQEHNRSSHLKITIPFVCLVRVGGSLIIINKKKQQQLKCCQWETGGKKVCWLLGNQPSQSSRTNVSKEVEDEERDNQLYKTHTRIYTHTGTTL